MKVFILTVLSFGLVYGQNCQNNPGRDVSGKNNSYNIENCNNAKLFPKKVDVQYSRIWAKKNSIKELSEDDFKMMTKVKDIDLSDNQIQEINPDYFKNTPILKTLKLNKNQIYTLHTSQFQHLPLLERIELNDNILKNLKRGVFKNLPNLNYIDLSSNQIGVIQLNLFINVPKLTDLKLNNNPCVDKDFVFEVSNDENGSDYFNEILTNATSCTVKTNGKDKVVKELSAEEPEERLDPSEDSPMKLVVFVLCAISLILNIGLIAYFIKLRKRPQPTEDNMESEPIIGIQVDESQKSMDQTYNKSRLSTASNNSYEDPRKFKQQMTENPDYDTLGNFRTSQNPCEETKTSNNAGYQATEPPVDDQYDTLPGAKKPEENSGQDNLYDKF